MIQLAVCVFHVAVEHLPARCDVPDAQPLDHLGFPVRSARLPIVVGEASPVAAEHGPLAEHRAGVGNRGSIVLREDDVTGLIPDLQYPLPIGGIERCGEPRTDGQRGGRDPVGQARSPHRHLRVVRRFRPRHERATFAESAQLPAIATPFHLGKPGDLSVSDTFGGAAASRLDVSHIPDPHLAVRRTAGQPRAVGVEGDRKGRPGARRRCELEDLVPDPASRSRCDAPSPAISDSHLPSGLYTRPVEAGRVSNRSCSSPEPASQARTSPAIGDVSGPTGFVRAAIRVPSG